MKHTNLLKGHILRLLQNMRICIYIYTQVLKYFDLLDVTLWLVEFSVQSIMGNVVFNMIILKINVIMRTDFTVEKMNGVFASGTNVALYTFAF